VVCAVDQGHFDVDRWVTRKNAVVESRLNALVDRLNVFARNTSTRDVINELVTATDARRLEVDLDNCELTRTTRLLDVSVFNGLNFFWSLFRGMQPVAYQQLHQHQTRVACGRREFPSATHPFPKLRSEQFLRRCEHGTLGLRPTMT